MDQDTNQVGTVTPDYEPALGEDGTVDTQDQEEVVELQGEIVVWPPGFAENVVLFCNDCGKEINEDEPEWLCECQDLFPNFHISYRIEGNGDDDDNKVDNVETK